ncbi:MAG TPA: VOC family protein [Chloroflexota bacterium]|nr:VOC family protein [Chloroflexota bacterium]
MHVSAMDHIVLNVADGEASVRFYADVLGLEPERLERWRAGEVRFPSVRVSDATIIDLVPLPEPADRPPRRLNLDHFCLVIEGELEPAIRELEGHGVTIERGPAVRSGARGDGYSVYIRDPDDNLIELRTYATARP